MPLPEPTLDNRRYDQLVGEGRALVPRLSPAWTDQNASDPGITLIELGAWLAEQAIYRFDRVSDEALRAFVRLCGIEPAMPGVAQAVVSVVNSTSTGVALPARVQLADAALQPRFETSAAVYASPAVLSAIGGGTPPFVDETAANAACRPFLPFGARPRPGHALVVAFDRALDAVGATLSLHVTTDHAASDGVTLDRLRREQAAASRGRCVPPDWRLHYRVRTVWEFHAGAGHWLPLADVDDTTRALTLGGFVRFSAPVGHAPETPGGPFPVRCRIVRGRFECPPRLVHVAFNAVPCAHALTSDEVDVGPARGHARAVFDLGRAPIVAGSVALRVDDGAGDVQTDWREVPDFERAGPFDRVVVLDPARGLLHSGDGLRAAILPAGHRMFATVQVGGGSAGNVAAGTLAGIPASARNITLAPLIGTLATPLALTQPFAATGGTPRETLQAAQARAFDAVSDIDKAVTLADFERLALTTPGVPVARVRAVAGLDARLPCWPAPGVVTLVVIPPCGRPVPMPSRALLDAVERWLDPRRLVTSEVHAVAPRYRRIGVVATLHLTCDAEPAEVLRLTEARFASFLDPLTGGLDGTGWPFGRTVYRTEVMAMLAGVPGVASVTGLGLTTGADSVASTASGCGCVGSTCGCGAASGSGIGRCDNVELCPHELVRPGSTRFLIESDTARELKRSDAHECEFI